MSGETSIWSYSGLDALLTRDFDGGIWSSTTTMEKPPSGHGPVLRDTDDGLKPYCYIAYGIRRQNKRGYPMD
ncbi:MAG: hypothetical protein MJZ68_10135, partial [archaeon]|nr:hypothetical protein [archaeon]